MEREKSFTDLAEAGYLIHRTAVEKGFYDVEDVSDINFVLSKLALIHSEVSETLEAIRKEQGEKVIMEEIADIMIRLLDFVELLKDAGLVSGDKPLADALSSKMRVNSTRPRLHGNLA